MDAMSRLCLLVTSHTSGTLHRFLALTGNFTRTHSLSTTDSPEGVDAQMAAGVASNLTQRGIEARAATRDSIPWPVANLVRHRPCPSTLLQAKRFRFASCMLKKQRFTTARGTSLQV